MPVEQIDGTWVHDLAGWLLTAQDAGVPQHALDRAALQLLDTLACAAGAQKAPPVEIIAGVLDGAGHGAGGEQATVYFRGRSTTMGDAVLVNGTAVRYLDFNDSFIGSGPGGHPSDNIPVALAFAERHGSTGRQTLTSIAIGYELYWRLRRDMLEVSGSSGWDGVSVSGMVAAAMGGLLAGTDQRTLAHALAIAGARGHTLGEVRRGHIAMVKASSNAMAARDGVMAVLFADAGLTGPPEVLEGETGLLPTLGLEPTDELRRTLTRPPEWRIMQSSIKAYPAIGTSQGAIYGAERLVARPEVTLDDIEDVEVRLPDSKATRSQIKMKERLLPKSRESADHSIPFLVACALREGTVKADHFEQGLWLDESLLDVMGRIKLVPDPEVAAPANDCYPAVVAVTLRDGQRLVQEVPSPPGSPANPFTAEDIAKKFADVQRTGLSPDQIDRIASECMGLAGAPSTAALMDAIR